MQSELGGHFFSSVLDTLPQHISILDPRGDIKWVNRTWQEFSHHNGGQENETSVPANYLSVCEKSALAGDEDAEKALEGIASIISGKQQAFYLEYPCHAPDTQRWFMMSVAPLEAQKTDRFVVSHTNITDRKLAELQVFEQALTDGLTGLANRRHFDDFFDREWRLGARMNHPISLILADIDHFKLYNDGYGHLQGDDCLKMVGSCLKSFGRRPGDLVARYGGEEFALVLGNTSAQGALEIGEDIRQAIAKLNLPHDHSPLSKIVSASIGVATCKPGDETMTGMQALVQAADECLYKAKSNGRNCVMSSA